MTTRLLKNALYLSVLLSAMPAVAQGQEEKLSTTNFSFNVSANIFWHFYRHPEYPCPQAFYGGTVLSASLGFWKRWEAVQVSSNLAVTAISGRNHLGNRNRQNSRFQVTTVFSPLITLNLSKKSGIYEELPTVYMGYSSSMFANYRSSISIGSSFITMPRGKGINIGTSRNRSQQLIILQARIGSKNDSIRNFSIHLAEDLFAFTNGILQPFADNWDRFYTGGAHISYRFNEQYKLRFYSEVYTGTISKDMIDNPDIIMDDEMIGGNFFGGPRRKRRLVAQEAGQSMFNNNRNFFNLQCTNPLTHFDYNFYAGAQGNRWGAWQQQLIHNAFKLNVVLKEGKPQEQLSDGKHRERLHHFKPYTHFTSLLLGAGSHFNLYR